MHAMLTIRTLRGVFMGVLCTFNTDFHSAQLIELFDIIYSSGVCDGIYLTKIKHVLVLIVIDWESFAEETRNFNF